MVDDPSDGRASSLETLPYDLLEDMFRRQTDMMTIGSLAATSKHMHNILRGSHIIRLLQMPNRRARQAVTPENQQVVRSLQQDEHFCTVCWMCKTILPVELEAIVVSHVCKQGCHPIINTNIYVLAYHGDISHLPSPLPAEADLHMHGIPTPQVPPYRTTAC